MPSTMTSAGPAHGMNFKHMPELEWYYGYYVVLGLMLLITLGMVAYFRHRRWL